MFVLVAGGGRTASQLASFLVEHKYEVRVVEQRPEILAHLHRELPTEVVYEGDPTDPDVLERIGIQKADVLVACMPHDADSLVLCFLARNRYRVPRTIAQVNDPRNTWLFDSKFHVDVALNQSDILARLIAEEMSLGDMMTLLKLRKGQYSIVEEKIPAGARAIGTAIKDLGLPAECNIAAIIRKGRMVVPHGAVTLEAGDEVLAVTDHEGLELLAALFASTQRPNRSGVEPAAPDAE